MRVNPKVDLYDSEEKEILLFDDGIQVKSQKAKRQPKVRAVEVKREQGTPKPQKKAVITDIVLLQKVTGGFEYIAAPINATGEELLDLAKVVQAKVFQEYSSETNPLNIVAITDGAKVIRNRLKAIFGVAVVVILDW